MAGANLRRLHEGGHSAQGKYKVGLSNATTLLCGGASAQQTWL